MPENGFLQGLFLRDQLNSAEKRQQMEIDASAARQGEQLGFSREQLAAQEQNWRAQLAQQYQAQQDAKQHQDFVQQFQIMGALAEDKIRPAGNPSSGLPHFDPQMMPPQAPGESQVMPGPWAADTPPQFKPNTGFDSSYVSAPMPAREGNLFTIGGQQMIIPSVAQRVEDDIAAKQMTFGAETKLKIARTQELLSKIDATPSEKQDIMQQALFPGTAPTSKPTVENITSRYLNKWQEAVREGKPDAGALYNNFLQSYQVLKELQQMKTTTAMARNPMPQLEVAARDAAGRIYQMASAELTSKKGQANVTPTDIMQHALGILRNPKYNKDINPKLIPGIEAALQNTTANPNLPGSITENINKDISGGAVDIGNILDRIKQNSPPIPRK